METKKNYKYFAKRGLSPLAIVGIALLVIGFIITLGQIKGLDMMLYIAGIACLVLASSGRAKETDINYQVSEKIKDLDESVYRICSVEFIEKFAFDPVVYKFGNKVVKVFHLYLLS